MLVTTTPMYVKITKFKLECIFVSLPLLTCTLLSRPKSLIEIQWVIGLYIINWQEVCLGPLFINRGMPLARIRETQVSFEDCLLMSNHGFQSRYFICHARQATTLGQIRCRHQSWCEYSAQIVGSHLVHTLMLDYPGDNRGKWWH